MSGSWQVAITSSGLAFPNMVTQTEELYSGLSFRVSMINNRAFDTVRLTEYLNCWQGTYS